MLQMRARSFALRDAFSDALAGMHSREEMEDEPREVEAVVRAEPKPAKRRTVDATADAVVNAAQVETKDEPAAEQTQAETKTVGEHLAESQASDVSVERCTAEFAKLWRHSDAGRASAKQIQASWKLEKVAELSGASDDDREAFLLEVGAALDAATGA